MAEALLAVWESRQINSHGQITRQNVGKKKGGIILKAKTKLTKLWSILLSLVMLLSLVPAMGVTALAAGSYPDANEVCVDDGKYFAEPGKLYYKNGDAANNFTGSESNYNAHYDPNTGVLTLDGYDGGSITAGGPKSKITVVLKGTNTINGNLVNSRGGDITITSESGGTLSITNTLSGSYSAIGIEAGFSSSYKTGNVTVKGNAKVTIDTTHSGESGYEKAYGIYAKENITISENASVDITCATPNNTYSNIYCNGLRADKNVTINTDGTIKINVIAAGDDGTQSYGIYPMGNATLTKVGEMEVQWKKHKTNTSYPGGAIFGSASFSDTDYAINVDTTNCYASYRYGTPRTVMVENGTLTGPGVKYANDSGYFLAGDKVNITPATKKGRSGEEIPFKEWTSSDVMLDKSATTASNSFTVPGKDVTVTAKHSPFVGTPTFTPTGTTGTEGTLTFKTVVKADETYEGFRLVKEGNENNESSYISIRSDTTSTSSPYEYSYETNRVSGGNQVDEGNYYVVAYLANHYYLSEKVTVSYTAAPTVTYPDHVRVYNGSGTITSLSDGECLTANDAGSASSYTGGSSYVARYDSGKLYLKDYHGVATDDMIFANGDLNIEIESNSSFTTSTTATNNLYGIQADGKLNISGPGKLTVTAKGRGDVYGIYAKEGVTISAPLDVRVGKNNVTENGSLYGIYTKSGAISLSDRDKTVTATGGTSNVYGVYNAADTSTTITNNGNIDISGKLTVNLSNGNYNRGISSQGGVITLDGATVKIPGSYYFGIFNKSGNVVIKNNSGVELTSTIPDGEGICAYDGGNLTIENSTVKVSAKGYAANLNRGKLSIKDSTVELTRASAYHLVVNTSNAVTNTIDLSGGGSVTITASDNQTGSSMIGGKVTATPGTKLEKGKHYPGLETYDGAYDAASDTTVLKFVHEATAPATYTVSGTATSFNSDTDNVTIQLILKGYSEAAYETIVKGNSATYSIANVAPGTYTMKVMKNNHVAREYTVTVGSSNVTQDVEIWLLGDVNGDGKVNAKDVVLMRRYCANAIKYPLDAYQLQVADVFQDGKVNAKDVVVLRRYCANPAKYPLN